jgi:hypothetical protein
MVLFKKEEGSSLLFIRRKAGKRAFANEISILIIILISAVFLISSQSKMVGFMLKETSVNVYEDSIGKTFTQNAEYQWQPSFSSSSGGSLKAVRIVGSAKGEGKIKVVLISGDNQQVVLDKIGEARAPTTGSVIEGEASAPSEEQQQSQGAPEETPQNTEVTEVAAGINESSEQISSNQITTPSENETNAATENPQAGAVAQTSAEEQIDSGYIEIPADWKNYMIKIVLENGEEFYLDKIMYKVDNAVNVENATQVNENISVAGSVSLIKNIQDISLISGSSQQIKLSDYFENAASYSAENVSGVDFNINGDILEIKSNEGFEGTVQEKVTAENSDKTSKVDSNNFNIIVSAANITIKTIQYGAVIGKPVKWKKVISSDSPTEVNVKLPAQATDVVVKKDENASPESVAIGTSVTGNVISGGASNSNSFGNIIYNFFKKLFSSITGFAVEEGNNLPAPQEANVNIDDANAVYSVEYETPAPYTEEQNISSTDKIITVIGPDEVHYENVLTYTDIPEILKVGQESLIKLYWNNNGTKQEHEFNASDSDGNGYLDYVEWNTPHLSEQSFEIIIEITKAAHLDSSKNFISDIYDSVKAQDGIWSEEINSGEYVRVTFEQSLTSDRDITVYAKSTTSSPASIEVYLKDGSEKIAEIDNILDEKYYKTYLTALGERSSDEFDLKVLNSAVSFDYIVDPTISVIIISPLNITYVGSTTFFNATSIGATWCGYSLDGAANITMTSLGSNKFGAINSSMTMGSHNFIYSCNATGTAGISTKKYFEIASTVTKCSGIVTPNTNYVLGSDITSLSVLNMGNSNYGCIDIAATNVSLDCNGHVIDDSAFDGVAIQIGLTNSNNAANANIKNCYINTAADCNTGIGAILLVYTKANNLTIKNTTINGNCNSIYSDGQNNFSITDSNFTNPSNGYIYLKEGVSTDNMQYINVFNSSFSGNIGNNDYYLFDYNVLLLNDTNANTSRCADTTQPNSYFVNNGTVLVKSCKNLYLAGYPYKLISDINSISLNCIDIEAANAVFDCAGYKINDSSSANTAVYVNANSATIKNCFVRVSPSFGGSTIAIAIGNGVSGVNIINNTINDSWMGLSFLGSNENINVYNSSFNNIAGTAAATFAAATNASFFDSVMCDSEPAFKCFFFMGGSNYFYLYNTTANLNSVCEFDGSSCTPGSIINWGVKQYWYVDVNVTNSTGAVVGASVNATNSVYPAENKNTVTGTNGLARLVLAAAVDYNLEAGPTWYSYDNYTINVSDGVNSQSQSVNMSEPYPTGLSFANNKNLSFTLGAGADSTPPYFTIIPSPTTIIYGQGFGVGFTGADDVAFDSYSINWTNSFSINQSGWLQNTTQLAAGTYLVNITINDTSGNINSTIYSVTVNKASRTCTLSTDKGWTRTYDSTSSTTNCTVDLGSIDGSRAFTINSQSVTYPNADSQTNAGSYDYVCQWTGGTNYSDCVQQTHTLTINNATGDITLLLNSASNDLTITYPQQANATATTSYGSATVYKNGSAITNAANYTFAAGYYNITAVSSGDANHNSTSITRWITISQATPTLTKLLNGIDANLEITYPTQVNASGSSNVGALKIYMNNTEITNNADYSLAAGYYRFDYNITGNENYSDSSNTLYATISKATGSVTLKLNDTENNIAFVYGGQVNASASSAYSGNVTLYRNSTDITSSENNIFKTLAVGYYNYTAIYAGNQNYSSASQTRWLNITKASSAVKLYLNNSESNINITTGTTIDINATRQTGEGIIQLYNNGTLINQGSSPLYNSTTFSSEGNFNITAYYSATENYSASSESWWVNVSAAAVPSDTTPPAITILSPENKTYYLTRFINLSVSLNEEGSWCGYSLDGAANVSMTGYNSTYFTAVGTFNNPKQYNVTFSCNDTSGNINTTGIFYFSTQDQNQPALEGAPIIEIVSPETKEYATRSITLSLSVISDIDRLYSVSSCIYSLDNSATKGLTSEGAVNNNFIFSKIISNLEDGAHIVNFQCENSQGLWGDISSRSFTVAVPSTTPNNQNTGGGAGGGGGGGGAALASVLKLDNKDVNIDVYSNANKEQIIKITNNGATEKTIKVTQQGLEGLVSFEETSFTLAPGETNKFKIIFLASDKTGVYTGKIMIGDQEVLVSVNARDKPLLFDASVVVPSTDRTIKTGSNLNTQITLIPMGTEPRVDVTINYIIKDYSGNIYSKESETVLIDSQKTFRKQLYTGNLQPGNYVVAIEVVYPNEVATSSAHFVISNNPPSIILSPLLIGLIVAVLILIFLVILATIRYQKHVGQLHLEHLRKHRVR